MESLGETILQRPLPHRPHATAGAGVESYTDIGDRRRRLCRALGPKYVAKSSRYFSADGSCPDGRGHRAPPAWHAFLLDQVPLIEALDVIKDDRR